MNKVHTKAELFKIMERFYRDKDKGISDALFGEIAGVDPCHLRDVFIYKRYPLTERVQRRVSRAYTAWKNGEIAIKQNRDRTRFVEYRKEAKPRRVRSMGIQLVNGALTIKVGISNPDDYTGETLYEQFERG